VYPWHPDPTRAANDPHEVNVITTPEGITKRILVSASGHLDALTLTETAGDGQPALAQTE